MARSLQDLFVDRDRQLSNFRRTLAGQTRKRLILVSGGPGTGKSWLLRLFIDACEQSKNPHAFIDFADNTAYDPLLLMRRFRDAFGPEHFNLLTQTINDVTVPRVHITTDAAPAPDTVLSFGENNDLRGANITVGDVAGGSIIKDNLFVINANSSQNRQELENRVTEAFFTNLATLSQTTLVVFIFDSYERTALSLEPWTSASADRWISSELLRRIRDGLLSNVLVVLSGRTLPVFGNEWGEAIGAMPLGNLTEADVAQYLRKNRGLTNLSDEQVSALFTAVQGNPQLLGVIGDNLEYGSGGANDDEW